MLESDDSSSFRVETEVDAGVGLLSLFGQLDLRAARAFEREMCAVEVRVRHVVADARGLTLLDAAGLHVFLHAARRARFESWDLTVVRGRATQHLFSLPAVRSRLNLVDDTIGLYPPLPPAA